MESRSPALVAIITVVFIFIFGAAVGVAQAETFCPEGGERFTGGKKFCPNHGVALKPVKSGAKVKTEVIDEVDPKIKALQSVLAKDPGNRRAWVDLGNRCFDLGKPYKAIEAYGKALEMDPSDIAVINDLAVMYKRTGEIEKAVATAHKTLDIDSTNKQALFNLGVMYGYDLKDYKSAVNYWSKLLQYYPDSDNAEQVRSGIAAMKKNEKVR